MTRRRYALATVALLALLATSAVHACPVCFGDSDAPIIKGLEYSIIFMVGLTYFLLFGGVATFLALRRRARRQQSLQAETA